MVVLFSVSVLLIPFPGLRKLIQLVESGLAG